MGQAGFADAVRQASLGLAARVDEIRAGRQAPAKRARRAALATVRYLLRAAGRPTPFGLFAGVARASVGSGTMVRWGSEHRAVARADALWLSDVIDRCEASSELLERLDVVFNSLAVFRGGRLEAPRGAERVSIRCADAVRAVREASQAPVRVGVLADKLAETFPGADRSKALAMLAQLVRQGFLITSLRAASTVADPLGHLAVRLWEVGAENIASISSLVRGLEAARRGVRRHNEEIVAVGQSRARDALTGHMRGLAQAGRTPLAVDLRLDCEVQLPVSVLREMERAAGALACLTRRPDGDPAWRAYHAAFCDRYGAGSLVPLGEVVDPDAGLGYPAAYPGSVCPVPPAGGVSERDERLLALAWQALADGSSEIVLTDEKFSALTDRDGLHRRGIPPHVELAARVHARSREALDRGEYTLTVAPARSAGTLTSRFTPVAGGSGLEEVYRAAPVATEHAIPAQMSFPPLYPHAENISRVPAYLPHLLSLGEHRGDEESVIGVDDLAVTATRDLLHLISVSRRRVVEPQVLHALALQKQAPPLARFLADLPRAFCAAWHEFDWGPAARRLPFLPRLRYGRAVISPARWWLAAGDLPTGQPSQWRRALQLWRRRWRCPEVVELRDADRTLRLELDVPAHAEILGSHLRRHGHALLTEAASAAEYGWIDGHAHEIAVPLVATRPLAAAPSMHSMPLVSNHSHGGLPGGPRSRWLYAKLYTHPERHDEIIAEHLPRLLAAIDGEPGWWFIRYRSPAEPDHLRLRLRTAHRDRWAAHAAAVATWAQQLRQTGIAGRLAFDTYYPEVGRYGHGPAMRAAEAVFAADSQAVSAALRHLPAHGVDHVALAAANLVDIARCFHTNQNDGMRWLTNRPAPAGAAPDRTAADQATRLARGGLLAQSPDWPDAVTAAWQARAAALAAYRRQLPPDTDAVLESLLHMHCNRAIGIDPDAERDARRIARQAALAYAARRQGDRT